MFADTRKYLYALCPDVVVQRKSAAKHERIEAIWLEYGKRTAYDLVELTHKQEP